MSSPGGGNSNIFGIFIPNLGEDKHIFQRGGSTTNQFFKVISEVFFVGDEEMKGQKMGHMNLCMG